MKFVLSLIITLSLPILTLAAEEKTSTYTEEQEKCSGEEDVFLQSLEEELANCKVQMPDVPSTADMNEAYYKVGDCSIAVANKLFDRNYKKYNNTEAIATASFWIRDLVKEYLYQARIECDDKAGFDSVE